MVRRTFLSTLTAGLLRAQKHLEPFFEGTRGTAVLVDVATKKILAVHAPEVAGRLLAPPGSTVKPFTIAALFESGKLRPGDSFRCPGILEIGGYNLSCSHPEGLPPMQARSAIAYSCNCFVARYATQFAPGELARSFGRFGLLSRTAWIEEDVAGELTHTDVRLQALGEAGVSVTAAGLAMAYTRLATATGRAWMAPVLGGMEDAVEFGTAQRARIATVKVAGKTGSVRANDGAHLAWFAGFVPTVAPKLAVAVMVQGQSGGADAAPLASRILDAAWRGTL